MRQFYLFTTTAMLLAVIVLSSAAKKNTIRTCRQTFLQPKAAIHGDSTKKKKKKDPVAEEIERLMPPVPSSFSPADSAQLIANWTLGIKFYKANCAKCHGIFGKGKDSIPNFSKEQMDDYAAAALAGDKQNHAVMAKMTMSELDAVFLFITNLKREDPPAAKQ